MKKNSFLYNIAADVHRRYGDDLRHLTAVFPNRRSGRVFQRHLAEQSKGPIWSPNITTIDDFFQSNCRLTLADPLTLLSILHELWNRQSASKEPFEQFYFFGKMILGDYDQVDKHLVNAGRLFGHILDLKEIEAAFPLSSEDSDALKSLLEYFAKNPKPETPAAQFLEFWKSLAPLYNNFKEELEKQGLAYSGMIYREVSNSLKEMEFAEKEKFIFAGFNRINRCEERLFEFLQKEGRADFYWNEDPLLLDEYREEAGKFLSRNLAKFPPVTHLVTDMKNEAKEFSITPVPFQSLQTQLVVQHMKKRSKETNMPGEKAGVVLNDEDLLMPLLYAIPSAGIKINVSAGLSLVKTPVYDLLISIIDLHEATGRYRGEFHYRQIEKIFSNPCLPGLYKAWLSAIKVAEQTEEGNNRITDRRDGIYFRAEELEQLLDHPLSSILFRPVEKSSDVIEMLLATLEQAYEQNRSPDEEDSDLITLMQEVIRSAHQTLLRLRDTVSQWAEKVDLSLLKNLVRDISQSRRIPFKGEPLTGIQLMGALESRNVTYDHLILPSLNEGIQPTVPGQSLIPFSLKKYFGLPTVEDEMADQAYYFRTLIAGAKTIDILYDNSSSGMKKSEKSRYVLQIEYGDYPHWTGRSDSSLSMKLENNTPEEITVERTPEIQAKLKEQLLQRGLSPSTFTRFLKCELQFYFSFILGADERSVISEEVDPRIMGSVFHNVMEELYRDLKDAVITEELIHRLKKQSGAVIKRELEKERKLTGKTWTGYDLIAEKYLNKLVNKMLDFDQSRIPFIMKEHERKINKVLEIHGSPIKFTGIVDRVHEEREMKFIVDYKTGKANEVVKKEHIMPMGGNDQEKAGALNSAAIQTLFYCWLLKKSDPEMKNSILIPAIYAMQKLNPDKSPVVHLNGKDQVDITTESNTYKEFEGMLMNTFKSLLNPHRPFKQTTDENVCTYCNFKNICMR